jgi:hypothetical protein
MINKKDQPLKQKWGDPELDKAQAESDAIFDEMDGLNELVEKGSITKQEAQARFLELLEKHRLIGERLLAVVRAWGATLPSISACFALRPALHAACSTASRSRRVLVARLFHVRIHVNMQPRP